MRLLDGKADLAINQAARPLLATLICAAALACQPAAAAEIAGYDALIQRARGGEYEPALAMLREHNRQHPEHLRSIYDHILIAGWAGRDAEAIEVYEVSQRPAELPAEIIATVARAYRNQQRWSDSLALYREGIRRAPQERSLRIGELLVLADSGQGGDAVRLGEALVREAPQDPDFRLALGYAYARSNQPYASLFEIDRALVVAPGRRDVVREYVLALQRAGVPDAALTYAARNPGLLDAAQQRRLEADAAAELVRLAAAPVRSETERFVIADRALARYDALIADWRAAGHKDDVVHARLDRIGALHARVRMKEVVAEYEALRREGVGIPAYVASLVASAYLYLREPEIARDLYRQSLAGESRANAERLEDESGLFHALVESETFDEALDAIDRANGEQPARRYLKGQPEALPNEPRLDSELTAATARLYADDTVEAQRRLTGLVLAAPGNTGLRTALAGAYLSRGWPRRAELELKIAEAMDPRDLGLEVEQGSTALELQEWRQAELLAGDTLARFPENLRAQRLDRLWRVHGKAELQVSGYRGITSNSPVSGNGDFGVDTVLYSPPIDYNWRAFAGGGYATGKFLEGSGDYRWARAGVEWRGRDLTLEAEASLHHYGYGAKPGLRLSGTYDADDHWQYGLTGEVLSRQTPLRALANGVSSNGVTGFVRWRASERREWTLALAPSRFSDGNQRLSALLAGRERLYTAPHLKIDLGVEFAASRNTRQDVPYFSPRSDLAMLPAVTATHTLYRRYETVWEQMLMAGAGSYSQKDYGTGAIGTIGYGQRLRMHDVFDAGVMVSGTSRPYDGQRERELRIVFDLLYRF